MAQMLSRPKEIFQGERKNRKKSIEKTQLFAYYRVQWHTVSLKLHCYLKSAKESENAIIRKFAT